MKNRFGKLINAVLVVFIGFVLVSCASTTTKKVKIPDIIHLPVQSSEVVAIPEPPKNDGVYIEPEVKSVNYKFSVAGQAVETELISSDSVRITFPAFVTEGDIKAVSSEAYRSYEYYLKNSKLSYGKGEATLVLGYDITPQEFERYMPYASSVLDDIVKDYITKIEEKNSRYSYNLNGNKLVAYRAGERCVRIDFPSTLSVEDIFALAQYAYDKYEPYLKDATVQIEEAGSVVIDFGYDITDGDFRKYAPAVETIIESYVSSLAAPVTPVKEEKVEVPVVNAVTETVKEIKEEVSTIKDAVVSATTSFEKKEDKKLPAFIGVIVEWFHIAIDWFKGLPVLVKPAVDWCIANPIIAGAAAIAVIVLIVLLCVSGSKKKKNKNK